MKLNSTLNTLEVRQPDMTKPLHVAPKCPVQSSLIRAPACQVPLVLNYAFLVLKWITVRGMVFWWSGSNVLGWKVAACCVLAVSQIVVPKPLHVERLHLAHDGWPCWSWCLITLKTKLSSLFCFCHFRLKGLMDLFTLSWTVSLRLKEGWNMGWCQRKRNLCSFSGKSTRSVSSYHSSWRNQPLERRLKVTVCQSVLSNFRVDTLIFCLFWRNWWLPCRLRQQIYRIFNVWVGRF